MHLRFVPLEIVALFGFWTLNAVADDKAPDLTKLKGQYTKAIQIATDPIKKKYIQELTLLQQRYTKQGDLDAALAVKTELESLSSKEAAVEKTPVTESQLKKAIVGTQWQEEGKKGGGIQFGERGALTYIDGRPSAARYEVSDEQSINLWWTKTQASPAPVTVSSDFTCITEGNGKKWLRIK